jgi:hypothetical protein
VNRGIFVLKGILCIPTSGTYLRGSDYILRPCNASLSPAALRKN